MNFYKPERQFLDKSGKLLYNHGNICGYGGIGRHARFRFLCFGVQVQVLLSAPEKSDDLREEVVAFFVFAFIHFYRFKKTGSFSVRKRVGLVLACILL